MQMDEMRLAIEYADSVSERYLAHLVGQTVAYEKQLADCRKTYRTEPGEPVAAPVREPRVSR
jgi:hypothetical protein